MNISENVSKVLDDEIKKWQETMKRKENQEVLIFYQGIVAGLEIAKEDLKSITVKVEVNDG